MEKGEENMDGEDGLFVCPPNHRIILTRHPVIPFSGFPHNSFIPQISTLFLILTPSKLLNYFALLFLNSHVQFFFIFQFQSFIHF
jgi:hypothetical protein